MYVNIYEKEERKESGCGGMGVVALFKKPWNTALFCVVHMGASERFCAYMCARVNMRMFICMRVCVRAYVCVYMHGCLCACVVCVCVCVHARARVCVRARACVCTCARVVCCVVCVFVCVYVCSVCVNVLSRDID